MQSQPNNTLGLKSHTKGDFINKLPSDSMPPSHNEIQIVDTLFKQKKNTINKFLSGTKEILIMGVLFIIFSLPFIDDIIKKFIKIAESQYICITIKAFLFMLSFFVINYFYLSRKNN